LTPFFWLRLLRRAVVLLVTAAVLVFLVVAAHVWWVARQDDTTRSDAIVVLGASQYNGRPSPVFAARLAHAATLYKEHVAPRVITVGGKQPGDAYTEAEAGRRYLTAHGVPASAVVTVSTGDDTLRSLRAVHTRMAAGGWHSAVLVTDPWHCLRARSMARDTGIAAVTSPERTGPAVASRGVEARYIARESVAYIYYELFHDDREHSAGAV
jgi:uncharacterized SAM-binding protein YcdF (DUF218 family)